MAKDPLGLNDEVKLQDEDKLETYKQSSVKWFQLPELETLAHDSASETSSIISLQQTIKISSQNIRLLDNSTLIGDSESDPDEVTASLSMEPSVTSSLQTNETSTLGQSQTEMDVKIMKNVRKSLNFDNMEPPISLQNLNTNESGLSSFLNVTGLTENLPFSFDSLRELNVDEDRETAKSLREQVADDNDINKDQLDETYEYQSDFSPTDGSDFDPENFSDEEYDTENNYDDQFMKRTKKRLKNKCEKLFKKFSTENNMSVKISSKDMPEEINSPKTLKPLLMECKGSEENESQYKSRNTKRSWTRRNACFYCQQVVTNFTRHLLRHHENEIEVIKYNSINDEDPKIRKMKRQQITDKIRNKGNFLHNSKVCFDRDGSMTLIPAKRRDTTSSPSTFATCKNCLGTFKRSTFFRHFKKCGSNTSKGRVLTNNTITIVPNTETASEELKKKILPHLRSDENALVVKNDRLILAYGTRLLKKKKERRSRKAICSKMRDLASLLMSIRKHDSTIETLTDALDPEKYEVFIASVKEMCGFNEETGQVRVPSIPARLLPAVLGCVDILYTQSMMSSESTVYKDLFKKKLDDFKQLITINWQWEVSSNAEKTKKRRHMIKENVLPLEDDIKTVMDMIAKLEVTYARKLKIDCNVINYETLCSITIAHIIMLDRKRAGDVAEAELSFYINRKNEEIPEEVLKTLTLSQRKTIQTLDIFQIPGKRTRSVPILLTKTMKENIDLIIACRNDLQIPDTNGLLFARPFTAEPFDGGKCLDKIKKLCNLKRPDMLNSTGMRHHIATMSQLHAKQNDQYTEHLAGFLGHDIAVHAKNYRLPLQVLQKAVVGSQLMQYESHQYTSSPQIINTEEQFLVPRREGSDVPIKFDQDVTEKNIQLLPIVTEQNDREESEENSEDEEISKDNKLTFKRNNKDDQKRPEEEKIYDREECNENHEEKSENENQEIHYKEDSDNVPEEPIIPKMNNMSTRFKRKNIDQTETKEKTKRKEKEPKKVRLDVSSSSEDFGDESCKKPERKKAKKRQLHDSEEEIKIGRKKKRHSPLSESEEEIVIQRRKKTHRFWSDEEIKAVKFYFKDNIKKKINPGKAKCLSVLKKEPVLHSRTWMQINTYVNNIYKKK